MRVFITGASGFIGSALSVFLQTSGHEVVWGHRGDFSRLSCVDAVIHLAGENIAKGFWSKKKKQAIRESRVEGTKALVRALASLPSPPSTFLSISAVGVYGADFLASVCREWEAAVFSSPIPGCRVVIARLGYVFSPKGGMLSALLAIFRLGLGAKIGDGTQKMPWVALEDVLRAFLFILQNKQLKGMVDVVSPGIVTQEELSRSLAKKLQRPCVFSIPAWLIWGEKARCFCLSSIEVEPSLLLQEGFVFAYPTLEEYLLALPLKSVRFPSK